MPDSMTIGGRRGEVLAYLAEHLEKLDEIAARTHTTPVAGQRLPSERLEHLEGLVRCVRSSVTSDGIPSPHYLRAIAAQACGWLEELRDRGEVSW